MMTEKKLPATFLEFSERFPEMVSAHRAANDAAVGSGPLDLATAELVKIGVCVGAGLESALKSHVRRALEAGASFEAVEQAIALGMTTVGFSRTVAAWRWAREQRDRDAGS